MNKKINKLIKYYFFASIVVVLVIGFTQLSFISDVNRLLTDQLQGQVQARDEIVIIGIDDNSLQKIGAWEWDRSVFAKAINNINKSNPSVIAIDVLFLEDRKGDAELKSAIDNSKAPIVLGTKLIDDEIIKSKFESSEGGFVNFFSDSDGIIRRISPSQKFNDNCELSLSLAAAKEYFLVKDSKDLCNREIKLRNNTYQLDDNGNIIFSYSKEKFKRVSFVDVYEGNVDPEMFKNKIVLIGSTALDLRSNLNDNFTSVFGDSIPGIEIHANVINSYLNSSFFNEFENSVFIGLMFVLSVVLLFCFRVIRKNIFDTILLVVVVLALNASGLFLYEYHTLFPFVQSNIIIFTVYIFSVVYRYYQQKYEAGFVSKAFKQYINPALLDSLTANPELLKLGGEKRNMTVLFSDIRSFTTISESLSSEALIDMLNKYLDYMSSIIIKNRGTIDKYIGDAIMALWNAPLVDDKHELNAVKSALEMKSQLADFNEKYRGKYPEIAIGIGINSGEMVVGNVGGEKRFDYTVLGDNVNLGARLEGLTKKYGVTIIITESVKAAVDANNIIFRKLDDVIVKGKNKSVKIYEPMDNKQENIEIKNIFAKGFIAYQKGRFEEAISAFSKIKDRDKTSAIFIERISSLTEEQKNKWDGVWKWEEK